MGFFFNVRTPSALIAAASLGNAFVLTKAAEKEQIFMELEAAGKEAEIEAKKAQAEKTRADARALIENLPMDQALKAAQIESARASAAKSLEDARAQDIENDAAEAGVMALIRANGLPMREVG